MKNAICFLLMIGSFSIGLGQTTTLPDKSYGEGGTKTVTTTTNNHGEKITVTEIKDSDGKVRDRNHTFKDANGYIIVNGNIAIGIFPCMIAIPHFPVGIFNFSNCCLLPVIIRSSCYCFSSSLTIRFIW